MTNGEQKILNLMISKQAVILAPTITSSKAPKIESGSYILVPRGDRRCRPVGWVEQDVLASLLASGAIVQKGARYILDPSYKTRALASARHGQKRAFANQHRSVDTRDIYHPDGIKRPALVNADLFVFRKLARATDKNGNGFLSIDEIEAGERFAADYARSMMAAVGTQNYSGVGSGVTGRGNGRVNTAENISISALDARKRVMDALANIGPGLDRALRGICGQEQNLGTLEISENWAKGSGKTVLKLALSKLSTYYGCRAGQGARPGAGQGARLETNRAAGGPSIRTI